jgi:hypothetical protein
VDERAGLDVTPGLADGPAVLENGVPGADPADGQLMSTWNQLTDVKAVAILDGIARIGWPPPQADTFARLELPEGHGHVVSRVDPMDGMSLHGFSCSSRFRNIAQRNILPEETGVI